ncbi:MAG: hypothetical protein HKN18_04710 [Silicimonas sp.]|nr:hypothetical protein [Silicimonas sp.]
MTRRFSTKLAESAKDLIEDEDGNTTVDWVVLLSGILGMTFLVMASISGGIQVFGEKAESELTSRDVGF